MLRTRIKSLARTVTDNALNHWTNLSTPPLNFRPQFLKARTVDQFWCKISHRVLDKLSARDPPFPVPSGSEGSASKFFPTWLARLPFSLLENSPSHWTGFFIAYCNRYKQVWWETMNPQRSCRLYKPIKDSTQHQDFLFSLEGSSVFSPARGSWGHNCRTIRCVDRKKAPTTRSPQSVILCISRKTTKTKVSKMKLPVSAFIWLLDKQSILKYSCHLGKAQEHRYDWGKKWGRDSAPESPRQPGSLSG